ncbi:uncharacterized protein LOC118507917 [Anopheles stephensi]|uniref:uncharacterized protein LOC118507917 n=1 Tax=Anopheles stephensi TaxID=30069 RepID=UPI001658734E|nr:uncharacterized protein LOC118507917 [Anopheles stephensi]
MFTTRREVADRRSRMRLFKQWRQKCSKTAVRQLGTWKRSLEECVAAKHPSYSCEQLAVSQSFCPMGAETSSVKREADGEWYSAGIDKFIVRMRKVLEKNVPKRSRRDKGEREKSTTRKEQRAAIPYEHTTLTADNYSITWASLLNRYDNSRMLIREYYRTLHHFPAVQTECVDELAHLVDEFGRHVNGLVKLHEPIEHWDTPLSNMLLMKLDPSTILAWEKHSVNHDKDKYKEVIEFLHERIRILKSSQRFSGEARPAVIKVAGNQRHPATHRRSITNNASMEQTPTSFSSFHQPKCPLACADNHSLRNCPVFLSYDTQQRRNLVESKGLCWNCLSGSHLAKVCRSDYSCRSYHERHHTLLHQTAQPKVTLAAHAEDEAVFLETAVVLVADDYGNHHEARALLDSGSMSNFMSERLARKLITTRTKVNVSVSGIGKTVQHVRGSITAIVRSKAHHFSTQLEFLILDTPSADIPTSPIYVSSWDMPNVTLADPTYHIPGMVDIVIGGDAFWELHTGHKRSLRPGGPWLVETQFGWAVAGNTSQSSHNPRICHVAMTDNSLEAIMTRFWETERILDDPALSTEEDSCEKHYDALRASTTTRNASGRYVVCLPINPNPGIVLGASREIAERRFLALERRLNANPQMKEAYSAFIDEYEKLGHMRKLSAPVNDLCPHYYLPHHAVVKEKSTSTKVRVVFDASCKTTSGFSLNDKLLVGPIIQQDLFTIMLRFRSHAIAITADVEKMYRQILHDNPDKNYLRILYRKNPCEPIDIFELQTVTYGTASAPFLATRTLKQIAYDQQDSHPLAVNSAVHIELVGDLTTTAFLGALRRVVARRGRIKELHSDNATTFKGASHELNRIYKMLKCNEDDRAQIFNWCANNEMSWKFIPPRAPHFGGLWEAAVKAAKKHIIRKPLTPAHYLIGRSLQAVPEVDYSEIPDNRLKEYQNVAKERS